MGTQDAATAPAVEAAASSTEQSSAPASTEGARLESLVGPGATRPSPDALLRIARRVRLEIVEPARALPLLSPDDYRVVEAYAQVYDIPRPAASLTTAQRFVSRLRTSWFQRLSRRAGLAVGLTVSPSSIVDQTNFQPGPTCDVTLTRVLEIISPTHWQRYEDEVLVDEGANSLGQIPLVHIQNTAVPFSYAGDSDVEPLIPLQDELNTRLSDRANRITLQSFKMYLGKGIENFTDLPVSPGRMWMTDNDSASITEFGGDSNAPSELAHIQDMRDAMDKLSAVTPIAAGAIKGKIGRLTSAAALRITLLALLSKTEKKRTSHGIGLQRMLSLSLAWLDKAGLFQTGPEERGVELHWPSPLPENDVERLQEAQMKLRLGVPKETVLRELGY